MPTEMVVEIIGDTRFVICVNNEDYPASLERRKIYQAISDPRADKHGLIRVVDESGEDYLYPANYFVPITLSPSVIKALALTASSQTAG